MGATAVLSAMADRTMDPNSTVMWHEYLLRSIAPDAGNLGEPGIEPAGDELRWTTFGPQGPKVRHAQRAAKITHVTWAITCAQHFRKRRQLCAV